MQRELRKWEVDEEKMRADMLQAEEAEERAEMLVDMERAYAEQDEECEEQRVRAKRLKTEQTEVKRAKKEEATAKAKEEADVGVSCSKHWEACLGLSKP